MQIQDYQGIIFDLDGVLWRGPEGVPGAAEAVQCLRRKGRKLAFITNYAAESRAYQHQKLRGLGIEAEFKEVFTSGYAAALYCQEHLANGRIHVFGPQQLEEELREEGVQVVSENADAVIVARDQHFSMASLNTAFQNLRANPECRFLVCSANTVHPEAHGKFAPGAGAMVAALEACSGRKADFIIGKPNPFMMQLALKNFAVPANSCAVIGDILQTDIVAGQRAGMESIFVLSGVGKKSDIESLGITPTHVLNSVADLIPHFQS